MGWGCYKHECDAGAESWLKKAEKLCNHQLKQKPKTWGRDGQICPWCYEELMIDHEKLKKLCKKYQDVLMEMLPNLENFIDINR